MAASCFFFLAGSGAGAFAIDRMAKRSGRLTTWKDLAGTLGTIVRLVKQHRDGKLVKGTPQAAMKKFSTACKPIDELIDYNPRESDVIVAVPAKSGTTVLQHICHQLRVAGKEPDWQDQQEVMPWLEVTDMFNEYGLEDFGTIDAEQVANPRVYKSHLPLTCLPVKAKKIYCFRSLDDVLFSSYAFLTPMFDLTWVPLDHWTTMVCLAGIVDKNHEALVHWWEHRNDENVLFLFYTDIIEDHAGTVKRVAEFMDIVKPGQDDTRTKQVLDKAVEQSTHKWMSSPEHKHRFDELRFVKVDWARQGRTLDPKENKLTGKVRKDGGKAGQGTQKLSNGAREAVKASWKKIVEPATGFATLEEMRAARAEELQSE